MCYLCLLILGTPISYSVNLPDTRILKSYDETQYHRARCVRCQSPTRIRHPPNLTTRELSVLGFTENFPLVPKLCLGTNFPEAPLPSATAGRGECRRRNDAELRGWRVPKRSLGTSRNELQTSDRGIDRRGRRLAPGLDF